MDEKYLNIFDSYSSYLDAAKLPGAASVFTRWADKGLLPVNDEGEIRFDELQMDDIADRISALASTLTKEKMVPKKLTLAQTMDLLKKGLKPYFYDSYLCKLAELDIDNEEKATDIKWLHPKMAEKINERYDEIGKLEVELHEYTKSTNAKIKDLQTRIKDIEEKGTDLIL
jgi:hypothetical protein